MTEPQIPEDALTDSPQEEVQTPLTEARIEVDVEAETSESSPEYLEFLGRVLEAALLAAGDTLSLDRMTQLFDEAEQPAKRDLLSALASLQLSTQGRGFELIEVASGWRFQVKADFAPWVNRLWEEKPQKYSRAMLETLALIAYRQPITRGDIEEVRGVTVSSHIMKTLAERDWIKVVGQRDVPGRPSLYATTRQFLDYFNLKNLEDLPSLSELKDIDNLNQSLQLEELAATEFEQIAEAKSDDEITLPSSPTDGLPSNEGDTATLNLFPAEISEITALAEVIDPAPIEEDITNA